MNTLSVRLQGKSFGGTPVLGRLDLDLPIGQVATLLGPSGCGKSTLLGMIAGLDRDYQGHIEVQGDHVAMVFQAPRLLPWRTLTQNIALIPGAGGVERARTLLDRVGLTDSADQYPEKVSLGMRRRVALARALAVRPSLILMDEPLVSLDAETAADMRRLIAETLEEASATALIATHDRARGAAPFRPNRRIGGHSDHCAERSPVAAEPRRAQGRRGGRGRAFGLVRRIFETECGRRNVIFPFDHPCVRMYCRLPSSGSRLPHDRGDRRLTRGSLPIPCEVTEEFRLIHGAKRKHSPRSRPRMTSLNLIRARGESRIATNP